jgi:hypothetical protein
VLPFSGLQLDSYGLNDIMEENWMHCNMELHKIIISRDIIFGKISDCEMHDLVSILSRHRNLYSTAYGRVAEPTQCFIQCVSEFIHGDKASEA